MDIIRYDISDGAGRRPIMSRVVVHGDTVYLSGIASDPVGDIKMQTQQVLDRIDALLQKTGTDKSKLLSAQIWLADMNLYEDFNAVWNAWVDAKHPPARACVRADLIRNCLVEIMVTAAK
ncbi:MAG: RidA family protein [Sulfurifustaceae bacterium]